MCPALEGQHYIKQRVQEVRCDINLFRSRLNRAQHMSASCRVNINVPRASRKVARRETSPAPCRGPGPGRPRVADLAVSPNPGAITTPGFLLPGTVRILYFAYALSVRHPGAMMLPGPGTVPGSKSGPPGVRRTCEVHRRTFGPYRYMCRQLLSIVHTSLRLVAERRRPSPCSKDTSESRCALA